MAPPVDAEMVIELTEIASERLNALFSAVDAAVEVAVSAAAPEPSESFARLPMRASTFWVSSAVVLESVPDAPSEKPTKFVVALDAYRDKRVGPVIPVLFVMGIGSGQFFDLGKIFAVTFERFAMASHFLQNLSVRVETDRNATVVIGVEGEFGDQCRPSRQRLAIVIQCVVEVARSVIGPLMVTVPPMRAEVCWVTFVESSVPLPPTRETPTKLIEALVLFVEVAVAVSDAARSVAPVVLPAAVEPPRFVVTNCAAPLIPPTLTPLVWTVGVDVEVAPNVAAPVRVTFAPDRS